MENMDVLVLRTLRDCRNAHRGALLATVVRTWGSSPRPVGSILALCEDGTLVGSVSGGCIEDDLIYRYTRAYAPQHEVVGASDPSAQQITGRAPQIVKYGVTADEAHRFGLPCGGTLELLLEFNADASSLNELVQRLEQGQLVERTVQLREGSVQLQSTHLPSELSVNETTLTNVFGPEYRLLMIGAGQLSEYLATMALFNGFAVTVCDPRKEYLRTWSVPGVTVLSDMPDDVVIAFKPDRRSAVVALTHDPKLDDLALLEVLKSQAFYIGAIGSRQNNSIRHQRMVTHFDESETSLKRLRGPIGIFIGSKTPSEISVSIMAEILAVKNGVQLPRDMQVGPAKHEKQVTQNDPGQVVCGTRMQAVTA
jgi:xanthine dehydrogenase accessory factor